jgi:peptidoglycan glycosyltransferase
VTLPFLSYGGSSLLITFISACILLVIDSDSGLVTEPRKGFYAFQTLGILFSFSFLLIASATGWWAIIRSNDLQLRVDNPRHLISARYVKRGTILDRNDTVIVYSVGEIGQIVRHNNYPPLSNTVGFVDSSYGSSGLEASLEDYMGGEKGYPAFDLWFNYLLYDQPLPGRDVRLTVDMNLQIMVDDLLRPFNGSAVVMNAKNGEILAIASHPYINSNELKESWDIWKADENSPFINRAVQGAYPVNNLVGPFLLSKSNLDDLSKYDPTLKVSKDISPFDCAIAGSTPTNLNQAISDGCSSALIQMVGEIGSNEIRDIIDLSALNKTPDIGIPINEPTTYNPNISWTELFFGDDPLRANPLQIAVSASSITFHGLSPVPKILSAVDTSEAGWVFLPEKTPSQVFSLEKADAINEFLKSNEISGWEVTSQGVDSKSKVAWYMAGTPPNWSGTPITIVLVLENQHPAKARSLGRIIFNQAIK